MDWRPEFRLRFRSLPKRVDRGYGYHNLVS